MCLVLLVEHLEVVALDEVLRDRREAQEDEEIVVLLLLLLVEEEVDERPQVLQRSLVHVGIVVFSFILRSWQRLVSAYGLREDQNNSEGGFKCQKSLIHSEFITYSTLHAKHRLSLNYGWAE